MRSVYSPRHVLHADNQELNAGCITPAYELPARVDYIRRRIADVGLGPVIEATAHDVVAAAARVHDRGYLDFMADFWRLWLEEGHSGPTMPYVWPARGQRDIRPDHLNGLMGYYSFDGGASFVEGTWEAVKSSVDTALTAADLVVAGETAAYALCRPPGHHAGVSTMGGYCFINNAAVTAQWLLDHGARRVSILDIDYHHGNGTQEIFYARADVQMINLHADTAIAYPFFSGRADEIGAGPGEGFNHNFPMPFGTAFDVWGDRLEAACRLIDGYGPDVVIVSMGLDTFEGDPISRFKLKRDDYPRIGARLARLARPTLVVQEGGYAVEDIGFNAVGVLIGLEGR
jgi:acetoin utilization deacetylase AcuC-like enzyme